MLVPIAGDPHCFYQRYLWRISQLTVRLGNRETVVCAVELDTMSCDEGRNPVIAEHGDALSRMCGGVQRAVRHMDVRRLDTDLLCYGREKYFLGERLVVAYVVGIPHRPFGVQGQQKPLHRISHVNERHRVISRPDDDSFTGAYAISHAPEVQAVARANKRTWSNDNGR